MIAEKHIVKLAKEGLKGSDNFLVEAIVKPGNRIMVFIDSDTDVSVDECIKLSKYIENNLDRDIEDFELMVSSAGLDHAFSQLRQYQKYVNRNIEVQLLEGKKFRAKLIDASEQEITVKKLIKKHKNKAAVEGPELRIPFSEIKETKPAVQFG
jgi:ribosome maturation factor RimP